MTSALLIDQKGVKTGEVELDEAVFGAVPHLPVMHQALLRQLANERQGTHQTKTRGDVRGGGAKPWRQKGTGRARQGSRRAPHWAGGGVVFGPHPHGYEQDMPRKQRRLALRGALSLKADAGQVVVLESFELELPQTKEVISILEAIQAGRRVLLVLGSHNEMLERSARNIAEVKSVLVSNLSVRDLLIADTVVMTKDAVSHLGEVLA